MPVLSFPRGFTVGARTFERQISELIWPLWPGKQWDKTARPALLWDLQKYYLRRCLDFYIWTFCCFQKMFNGSIDWRKKKKQQHFHKLLCSPLYTRHFQHLHVSNHIVFFHLATFFHTDARSCSQICTSGDFAPAKQDIITNVITYINLSVF